MFIQGEMLCYYESRTLFKKKKLSIQKETQLTDLFPSEAHHRASFPGIGTGEQGKAGT